MIISVLICMPNVLSPSRYQQQGSGGTSHETTRMYGTSQIVWARLMGSMSSNRHRTMLCRSTETTNGQTVFCFLHCATQTTGLPWSIKRLVTISHFVSEMNPEKCQKMWHRTRERYARELRTTCRRSGAGSNEVL